MASKKHSAIESLAAFDAEYAAGRSWLVGIDEAGRGCLAGPVCAAAAAVKARSYAVPAFLETLAGLDDSKKLSEHQRAELYAKLVELKKNGWLDFEAAFASVDEIEKLNILGATQLAMARAARKLDERLKLYLRAASAPATLFGEQSVDTSNACILIDGKPMKKFPYAHTAVVKGDASSLAVAAASIVAKVSRDALMDELARKYPRYGFEAHKGYGTAAHLQNLMRRVRHPQTEFSEKTPRRRRQKGNAVGTFLARNSPKKSGVRGAECIIGLQQIRKFTKLA